MLKVIKEGPSLQKQNHLIPKDSLQHPITHHQNHMMPRDSFQHPKWHHQNHVMPDFLQK